MRPRKHRHKAAVLWAPGDRQIAPRMSDPAIRLVVVVRMAGRLRSPCRVMARSIARTSMLSSPTFDQFTSDNIAGEANVVFSKVALHERDGPTGATATSVERPCRTRRIRNAETLARPLVAAAPVVWRILVAGERLTRAAPTCAT